MPMEHRKATRCACFAKVWLIEGGGFGQIRDIAKKGIRVAIVDEVKFETDKKESFYVTFEEEALPAFSFEGIVRWSKKDEMGRLLGIEFLDSNDEQTRLKFTQLLEYYEKKLP
jgi:hypothetical protein